jgi:hypothetical protein
LLSGRRTLEDARADHTQRERGADEQCRLTPRELLRVAEQRPYILLPEPL